MLVDGSKLKAYRKENNLTREQLAESLDLTAKTVQRIENGESSKETTIRDIESKLGIILTQQDNITEKQRQAIESDKKYIKVLAGAGAGKTRVIEERIAKKLGGDLKPGELIVCTYTEKAANELKMRTQSRLKEKNIAEGSADIIIGTIHGICMRLLREYSDRYNDYTVLDTMKNMHFINRHFVKIGVDKISKIDDPNSFMGKYYDTNRFMNICNTLNENPVDMGLVPVAIKNALDQYKNLLRKFHYFDFATIQCQFLYELRNNSDFRDTISNKIKYLIVDEYQDVNYLQSEIFKELMLLGVGAMVVGDADQSIYQFRGSDYNFIRNFENELENVEVIKLEDNFRSTDGIISIAEESIQRNSIREDKHMISKTGVYEKGDIAYKEFADINEEYNFIADRIQELIEMGMPPQEIAVLFRKKKYMQELVNELNSRNLPFEVENVSSLFNTKEIRAAIGIFEYLKDEITEEELMDRWGFLSSYCERDSIKKAITMLMEYKPEVWQKKYPTRLSQEYLLQDIYDNFLGECRIVDVELKDYKHESILFNLGRFSQLINDFEVINFDFPPSYKVATFYAFLVNTKDEYPEGYLDDAYKKVRGIRIMTIHKSKGLQFSAVFIPNLCHNIFPASRVGGRSEWHFLPEKAVLNANVLRALDDRLIEDERRVFYVAITRSRKFLFLTRADYGTKLTKKTSIFLSEARSASGYIYEYDSRICNFGNRQRWKAFKEDENVFSIDFTNLSDFFKCGLGFKISQIYGFVNPINLRMGYGESIHSIAKEINKHVLETKSSEISDEKLGEVLDGFYLPYVGGAEKVRKILFEKAQKCIKKYVTENASKFTEVEYVEKYVEVPIRKDILISGRIDLIRKKDVAGRWHIIIVDYKTGEKVPTKLEERLQLEIYAMGYKNLTGENADVMEIVDIEGNEVISSRAVVQDNLDDTAAMIEVACDDILDNSFSIGQCSMNQCKTCVQKHLCGRSQYRNKKNN